MQTLQPQSAAAGDAALVVRGTWRLANCGRKRSYKKVVSLYTKWLAQRARLNLEALGLWQEAGRAESAPKVSAEVEAWLASPHKRRVGEVVRP